MSLLKGFDPDQVEDTGYPDDVLIPAGKYRVMLTNVKEDVSQNGKDYVKWRWVIVGGKLENQTFDTMHFPQSSEGSMKAFQGHTKSLCRALKLAMVKDYDDLLNKPVIANVQVNKYTDKNGNPQEVNRINYFEASGKHAVAKTQAQAATKRTAKPVAEDPPPFDDDTNDDGDFNDPIPF